MIDFIMLWIIAAVVFLALDMVWLSWVGKPFYVSEIGTLLREQPSIPAAVVFYVLYVTCLVILVIKPAFDAASITQGILYGAVFGLAAYGTYDFTSLAVLKGFTTRIALIDLAWGTALTAVSSGAATFIAGLFKA